jgi:hypothetical protein
MESVRTNILEPFSRNFTRVAKILKPALHFYGLFDENVAEFAEVVDPVIDMGNALATGGLSRMDDYIVRTQPWQAQGRAWTDSYGTKYYRPNKKQAPRVPPRRKKLSRVSVQSRQRRNQAGPSRPQSIAEPRTYVASYNGPVFKKPRKLVRPRRASYGGGGDITWNTYRNPKVFSSSTSEENEATASDYLSSSSSLSSGLTSGMGRMRL